MNLSFDNSVDLAVIISICALFSAPLTNLLNDFFLFLIRLMKYKNKRRKENLLYKRSIFENYLKYAGLGILSHNTDVTEYSKYYPVAYMLVPNDLRKDMAKLHRIIIYKNENNVKRADKLLESIATRLALLLRKS